MELGWCPNRIAICASLVCRKEVYYYLCNHWHPREEESNVQSMEYCGEFLDINFNLNSGLFMQWHILLSIYLRLKLSFVIRKWVVDGSRLSIDKVIQVVQVKQLMQLVRVTRVNTSQLSCFSTSSNFPFFVFFYHFQGVVSGENNDANSAHLVMKIFHLFICPGQLNSWPCHSLSEWVSEWVRFWFQPLQRALQNCGTQCDWPWLQWLWQWLQLLQLLQWLQWLQNYNDYNNYRDSDLDLDLDWEQFSKLVTQRSQLTITDKLRNLNYDMEG